MNNVLYRKVLVPANRTPDGEAPVEVNVTQENNGYCAFITSFGGGTQLLRHELYDKDALIEWACTQLHENPTVKRVLSAEVKT